ncbi:MAG: twin transmembrane helix small protein [Alphaproteobacteria bacterium]
MAPALPLIMAGALGLVLLVLLAGLLVMARGGRFNVRHGNTLMRLRVAAQAVAVLVFLLLMYLTGG